MKSDLALWSPSDGRELDATPLERTSRPARIVACLNVWNDLLALEKTVSTWIKSVDHVIAVDGAYDGVDAPCLSTDGTREFLQCLPANKLTLIDAGGLLQCEKRTRYLSAAREGDLLFVIDADESVVDAKPLRAAPLCDVGWIRIESSLYDRPYGQPRLFRWRPGMKYEKRHHWIFCGGRLLCSHQYGGTGFEHVTIPLTISNQRKLGRSKERLYAKSVFQAGQVKREEPQISNPPFSEKSDLRVGGRESLQIVHHAYRDDGLAPSRLHTAINRTTPHSSLFFKSRPGPFDVPEQFSAKTHALKLASALTSADVVHYHGAMSAAKLARTKAYTVFHQHGTLFRDNAEEYMRMAEQRNALVLLSNLELFTWTNGRAAHFLPNPVPVARYRMLREQVQCPFDGKEPFRVAHSPSHPLKKGTAEFLTACDNLQKRGVPIQPIIINGQSHRQTLAIKATCHASFDSFWLGMQCSGIEAAAMGMPVIAGDPIVAKRYIEMFGDVPYTYANDVTLLEHELFTLIDDAGYRARETERVHQYVVQYHDESAVALRYLDLLDDAFGWRTKPYTASSAVIRSPHRIARRRVP